MGTAQRSKYKPGYRIFKKMKYIRFDDPHRQKHFDFFNRMSSPHFSLTAPLDITKWLHSLKAQGLPFTPAMAYLLASAANEIPAFRWRIRGQSVVEHEQVSPSFTVQTAASSVFSFCTVEYHPSPRAFLRRAQQQMAAVQETPSFEDEPGRDDFLFLSSIPWVAFTQIQHAMQSPADSVPRIAWGKYLAQDSGKVIMPVSVQAHHAVVDGQDMGQFFEILAASFAQEANF